MHEFSNKQLITLIQANHDEKPFEELFKRYYGKLRQLVSYKISSTSDIDDIVQEIFIKIFANINQLRDPDKFESWINQIVFTQVNSYYRRSYSNKELPIEQANKTLLDTIIISESSEDVVMQKFELSDIYDIILGFPSDRTRAFLLRHLHGMSYEEIAATTEEKHSTVRGKIARMKDNIIDEIFNKETPKEVRERISAKLSQLVSNGEHLERHLKGDYFQNQELLEAINPARIEITKPRIYFYESLDNVMILSDRNQYIQTCLIKVKSKSAIPILLNRVSTFKKLHCVFLSVEYIDEAKKYLQFIDSETINSSFVATPILNIKSLAFQHLTKCSLDNKKVVDHLMYYDPQLRSILKFLTREYGADLYKYKFFVAKNPMSKKISAYAFFLQVDTYLWELGRYNSFEKLNENQLKQCISAGTNEFLSRNYYISNAGVAENDNTFLEVAPVLGFEIAYQFISGTVKIK